VSFCLLLHYQVAILKTFERNLTKLFAEKHGASEIMAYLKEWNTGHDFTQKEWSTDRFLSQVLLSGSLSLQAVLGIHAKDSEFAHSDIDIYSTPVRKIKFICMNAICTYYDLHVDMLRVA